MLLNSVGIEGLAFGGFFAGRRAINTARTLGSLRAGEAGRMIGLLIAISFPATHLLAISAWAGAQEPGT
jgi:hypothetical protein